ncbi:MAG: hypothetical protein WA061_03010 [Microgenomates group bacterium]
MIKTVFAQDVNVNGMTIKGPLVGFNSIADIINNVVPFIMSLAGVILFFVLMWGGFDYVTSQGAPEKLKTANAKITAGVIGFVILVLSFLITRILSYIFGVGQGII